MSSKFNKKDLWFVLVVMLVTTACAIFVAVQESKFNVEFNNEPGKLNLRIGSEVYFIMMVGGFCNMLLFPFWMTVQAVKTFMVRKRDK
jgi:hypothetical protein